MKRIISIVLLMLLFFFSASIVFVEAGDESDENWCNEISEKDRTGGLVPCGRDCGDPTTAYDEAQPCQLCHFFMMIDNYIDGLFFLVVPVLAVLMIAIGGFMYIVAYLNPSGAEPEMLGRAKKLFTSVVIGLLIIYSAYIIIGLFLRFIGLAEFPTNWYDFYQSWWKGGVFEIPCP